VFRTSGDDIKKYEMRWKKYYAWEKC